VNSTSSAAPAPARACPLSIANLSIAFGGLKAVQAFSLELPRSALFGLIGPNGAGKTTVFNLLTGVYRPDSGTMQLDGKDLVGSPPHLITAAGIARTFQNIRLFGDLSVLDNVRLGAQVRTRVGVFKTLCRGPLFRRSEAELRERAERLLEVLGISEFSDAPSRSLCYGHQRRLEIARALATCPKVLLLDEPAAGMNPQEKKSLAQIIERLPEDFGVSILLIDHDMGLVMNVCERITVLDHGEIIAAGTPTEIQNNSKVIAAYLGEPTDD
jgi:branched-chain amino acid transport system ATP-binding protein